MNELTRVLLALILVLALNLLYAANQRGGMSWAMAVINAFGLIIAIGVTTAIYSGP